MVQTGNLKVVNTGRKRLRYPCRVRLLLTTPNKLGWVKCRGQISSIGYHSSRQCLDSIWKVIDALPEDLQQVRLT